MYKNFRIITKAVAPFKFAVYEACCTCISVTYNGEVKNFQNSEEIKNCSSALMFLSLKLEFNQKVRRKPIKIKHQRMEAFNSFHKHFLNVQ